MGRNYIAKNTCWKLCVPGLILFEKKKDCWKIVKKNSIDPSTQEWSLDCRNIWSARSMGYSKEAHISLDSEMIDIDDE